jgi:hypothetical protein
MARLIMSLLGSIAALVAIWLIVSAIGAPIIGGGPIMGGGPSPAGIPGGPAIGGGVPGKSGI